MGKAVLCKWHEKYHMQHRWEDLELIADVIRTHRPRLSVELGTDAGGFAAFLSDTVAPWGGRVVTVDNTVKCDHDEMANVFPNLTFIVADALGQDVERIRGLITVEGPVFLYCDNGNKERELELYAPHLGRPGLLGCHDWADEVRPIWACDLLASLDYQPERHEDFEALANPPDYPVSMSRFFLR